ncbi:cbb3-type cytochrome c oxidase subunit I [Desulfovibrio sp.]|uniref:nitric-oxide reductase large subunit n=1 Tax=Desulfovibrio sp. TaxID=885 RepID=UPI0023CB9D94|nr:cbb3-type cytochrome c oxidase subunit I [Desulfovibrio sp.]MDE7240703.1 cbb3-type cytochrome c oxidase subunit I [Desulfovibrio sp.]
MSAQTDGQFGQVLRSQEGPAGISRWWIICLSVIMIFGFTILLTITGLAFVEKPPIPEQVVGPDGRPLFTAQEIKEGQEVFLAKGLMSNGTVWGHGSYLGPDFPALTLHRVGEAQADLLARSIHGKPFDSLSEGQRDEITALVPGKLRVNRYDAKSGTLVFTPAETVIFEMSPALWREYLASPVNNGGLKANLITDPEELRKLSAYFSWMAWASVAPRPGSDVSYTNNFPYDPLVGNHTPTLAFIWSAASLLFLLGGIGLALFVLGRNPSWDWTPAAEKLLPGVPGHLVSPSQGALVKFVVVVALLLLTQTLVGGGVAHFRADPGNFYGFDLSVIFPSSLLRTWHLQLMIFWLATGFVVGGLFLSRVLGGKEYDCEKNLTNLLFAAFAVVIFGSLLCDWGGMVGFWPKLTFWLGSQGWEYLEIGRFWQFLLIAGLLGWFVLVVRNAWPSLENRATRALTVMFLISAFTIPFFYLPAIFYTGETHYTIVDTWRFWIIHLWVEGFFELFATAMVALIFIELGLVTKQMGLRMIFLDGILVLSGGIIGTGHHWYFSGMGSFNMTMSGCFSALELVPLVLLCMEAGRFIKTTENPYAQAMALRYRWPLRFIMSVGFWNFVGAGVFGFLINMPVVSYFEIGTYLTPNHGHAAMFGVFGLLSLSLCLLVLRQANSDENWAHVEKYVRVSFWGFNVGLLLMLVLSLLPAGFLQLGDVFANGYWHARSPEFTQSPLMAFIGWLRMPADLIFIIFGAIPFFIAALKPWSFYIREGAPRDAETPAENAAEAREEAK